MTQSRRASRRRYLGGLAAGALMAFLGAQNAFAQSVADVANYSYVVSAPEGRVALDAYPAIVAWLRRVEALPGFVPMPRSAVGLHA